jgi:hypothetical protein
MTTESDPRDIMSSSRKRAAVAEEILSWLDFNYELSEGVCLPRSLLYQHYLDHCQGKNIPPIGAAAFGKVSHIPTNPLFPATLSRKIRLIKILFCNRWFVVDFQKSQQGDWGLEDNPNTTIMALEYE